MPLATARATRPKNAPAPSLEYAISMPGSLARGALRDLELGSVDLLRRELFDALGDGDERLRRLVVRVGDDERPALVGADAQLRHQRHLPEERDAQLVGELTPATRAEQLVRLAVVAA